MRQQDIEDQLTILWRTLPVRGVIDPDGVLEDYQFALQDCSAIAVKNTISALRAGLLEGASTTFCPKAPELAVYARAEQRRLDAVNRTKEVTTTYRAVEHEFKDWRIVHRQRAAELAAKGFQLVAENIDIDTANMKAKRRVLKPGTIWLWSISEAWSPA